MKLAIDIDKNFYSRILEGDTISSRELNISRYVGLYQTKQKVRNRYVS